MGNPEKKKSARTGVKLTVPLLMLVLAMIAAILIIHSDPVLTIEKKTSGNLTFSDGPGNLINGMIEIRMTGGPSGGRSNVNSITWRNAPNALIYFDAHEKKDISINLRISGDSPSGRVSLEDYGAAVPGIVGEPAPGVPVKYVESNSSGVSFADADISIYYTNSELNGQDEIGLVIYTYNGGAWTELPSRVDSSKNIVTATVESLSIFALSTRILNDIVIRDSRNKPVVSHIRTYDGVKNLKKEIMTSALTTANVTEGGELEVNALESKNVAVRLKVKGVNRGEVVLDDFGKTSPVSAALPGVTVKYVEIGARNISFASADITIHYTDAELNGGSEDALTIYHWDGASWNAVPTIVDKVNKTLSTSTESLSFWGIATLYQKAMRCDTGTSIGTIDTTDIDCAGVFDTSFSTGLLQDPAGTNGGYISLTANFIGERLYGYFVDNSAYPTDVNITGINGSISMRLASAGNTAYGKYQLGYYDPNGAADNFVGLFNSTETSGVTTATITSYTISFNNQYGIIPKNMKLAIRLWTRTTNNLLPRFYIFRTTPGYDSSINYTISTPDFSISGYITNKSSGLPLSDVTVQTNTSLSAITNASGYYIITGISNDTYIVTASLQNYATNSTNVTVSGTDVTSINISLSPLPTYLVSGYVTNVTSGAAISSANVTTNTSQTTTTNATGYYNFTLSNGTYLITGSKVNHSDNFTIVTINGAAVSNANITLSPAASMTGRRIFVVTDRYVVLDDPNTGTVGTGFSNMASGDSWGTDRFFDNTTNITIWAMVLDIDGKPVNNTNVNFTLKNPGNDVDYTLNKTTDINGLVNLSHSLNAKNYYGKWVVYANATAFNLNGTYSFIYNWWGCANSANCNGHGSETVASGAQINSPFTEGHDAAVNANSNHRNTNACVWCHQSYDGNGSTTGYLKTQDIHKDLRCDNSGCHGTITQHNTNMITKSCYNSTCHNRTDMTMKSTMNGVVSAYANTSDRTGLYNNYHTPNSTVPCIICHGPMHNITKPDEIQRFINNNDTEDSHCIYCHQSYNEHNRSVPCTLCHSDDVHDIQVFAQNATGRAYYMNVTHLANPPSNCTLCHQNGISFFNSLENNVTAGNYTKGRDPPQVAVPLEHSNNNSAGARWNQTPGYWTNSLQLSWCLYCHGSTTHSDIALGRPAGFDGDNIVNSSISLSSWCSSCHWQDYTNGSETYESTISTFEGASLPVPPEITRNATYGADESRSEYFNHTNISIKSDNSCYGCHRNGTSAISITDFMHNLTDVSSRVSGPDCIGCHDYTRTDEDALHRINNSDMKTGVHASLNKNATNSTGISSDNRKCWGCHTSDGSEPRPYYLNYYDMGNRYANPYECYDCHNSTGKAYDNVSAAPQVFEHFKGSANVTAASNTSDNSSSCVVCHDLDELKVPYSENDIYNSGPSNASHYTKNRTDLRTWDSGKAANCSYCHQNTSTAFAATMLDPAYNSSINNHSAGNSPTCYNATCHNSGWIHNSTLARPALNSTNASSYCRNCHPDKWKHNNTMDCGSCHFNFSSKDTIHPVKYLLQDASYGTANSTAVTCITCHQSTVVDSRLSQVPPKTPSPLHHSDNTSNGTIWNSTAYWTSSSPLTSCSYCHSDTKHNISALGRPAVWQGNNIVNSSLSSGTWCASCHYKNYSGGGKSYIDMTQVFSSANLSAPPEITNGSYANRIFNRSNYYNHSLKGYTDEICGLCHGINLSSASSVSYLMHNISGASCTGCHYSFEAMNNTTRPDRYVDSVLYNTSLHGSLSCTDCHTQGHRNMGARKACEDCHAVQANPVTDKDRHNITPSPSTYFVGASNVVTITDCTTCHSASLYNTAIATYGYLKPKDCDYCHTYPDKIFE